MILALQAIKLLLVGSTRETSTRIHGLVSASTLDFLRHDIRCKKHTHDASEALLFYALQRLFYERSVNIWAGKQRWLMVHAMDEIGTCRRGRSG
jgi:hypothetical protein